MVLKVVIDFFHNICMTQRASSSLCLDDPTRMLQCNFVLKCKLKRRGKLETKEKKQTRASERVCTKRDSYGHYSTKKTTAFGHICRSQDDRLVKKVLLGSVDGARQIGRPPKKWTDNITEWTKLTCVKL